MFLSTPLSHAPWLHNLSLQDTERWAHHKLRALSCQLAAFQPEGKEGRQLPAHQLLALVLHLLGRLFQLLLQRGQLEQRRVLLLPALLLPCERHGVIALQNKDIKPQQPQRSVLQRRRPQRSGLQKWLQRRILLLPALLLPCERHGVIAVSEGGVCECVL